MGHTYQAVGWNQQKKRYDLALWVGILSYLIVFIGVGLALFPTVTIETLLIRGLATAAFVLLHIILLIGPICRLDTRFLPLLYNRRHMGVSMFILALAHAVFATIQFHTLGDLSPLASILVSNDQYSSLVQFPFQPLGLFALLILFVMAATSHDFWLSNLTAPVWKALHMLVYVAYALVVLHVAMGALQAEPHIVPTALVVLGMVAVLGAHLAAALRERKADVNRSALSTGYVDVCHVDEIPEKRAKVASVGGERVAIFKYDGKLSAVSSVCQHQNGPLGEGRVIDGMITCPWHGYQYCPHNGASPEPFTEKVPTFKLKLEKGRVHVLAQPNPPGTEVTPLIISNEA